MMDVVVESFKTRIQDGCYHRAMVWLSGAAFGRINHTVLVIEHVRDREAVCRFLTRLIPRVRVCRGRRFGGGGGASRANLVVFSEALPRTTLQLEKLSDLQRHSNVVLFCNNPGMLPPVAAQSMMRFQLELTADLATDAAVDRIRIFVQKYYCLYNINVAAVARDSDPSTVSPEDLVQKRSMLRPFSVVAPCSLPSARELSGIVSLFRGLRSAVDEGGLSLMTFLLSSYDNALCIFQWIVRAAAGVRCRDILVIRDATGATQRMLEAVLPKDSLERLWTADEALVDYETASALVRSGARATTNCVYIVRSPTSRAAAAASLTGGPRAARVGLVAPPPDFYRQSYELFVKEPNYVPFLEGRLLSGAYAFDVPYEAGDLLDDYGRWCGERDVRVVLYAAASALPPARSFFDVVSPYIDCERAGPSRIIFLAFRKPWLSI